MILLKLYPAILILSIKIFCGFRDASFHSYREKILLQGHNIFLRTKIPLQKEHGPFYSGIDLQK